MKPITLTDDELRTAFAGKGGGRGNGRPSLFPDKKAGMIFLTSEGRAKLRTHAAVANVSLSDFLEVLIRRYGAKAEADFLDAAEPAGGDHGADVATN